MEEGFSSGPAGAGCWLFLPWQPRAARADSTIYQPAKLSVIISESEQPGAAHFNCLGNSDNSANAAVEQSGSRVSRPFQRK